jgi:hypothetical protein
MLDLPGRVCAMFLALGGANAVLRWVSPLADVTTVPPTTEETHA